MSSSSLGRLRGTSSSSSSWQLLISMVMLSSWREGEVVWWGGTERAQPEEVERESGAALLHNPSPYLEGKDLSLITRLVRVVTPPKHTLPVSFWALDSGG